MALNQLPELGQASMGNEAIAMAVVNEFAATKQQLANQLTRLLQLENAFGFCVSNSLARDKKEVYDQQANKTICLASGGAALSLFTIGGAGMGMAVESSANNALAAEESELETMQSYRSVAQERVDENPGTRMTTLSGEVNENDQAQMMRLKRLSEMKNFKESNLDKISTRASEEDLTDRRVIELADENEAQAIVKHLDDLISEKQSNLSSMRVANNRRGDTYNLVIRSIGGILENIAKGVSAYFEQKAGDAEAKAAIDQPTSQLIQSTISDYMTEISKYLETAPLYEVIVSVAQGDVYRA